MTTRWQTIAPSALALVMVGAGVGHFVLTDFYADIVPRALPARPVVYVSGVAELACAAGLLHPRTRRVAAWATAALFVVVFPANVQMALDGGVDGHGTLAASPVFAWLRLPLQIPLVLWAIAVARRSRVAL